MGSKKIKYSLVTLNIIWNTFLQISRKQCPWIWIRLI